MTLNKRSFAITVFLSITLLSTPVTMSGAFAQQSETQIPSWIKNNAGWWADGLIDESSFIQSLQFLIKEEIIQIPQTTQGSTTSSEVPSWIKNNAGWWADGSIDDDSFVQGIQFLVKEGVMQVSTNPITETNNDVSSPTSPPENSDSSNDEYSISLQKVNESPAPVQKDSDSKNKNNDNKNNNQISESTNTEKKLLQPQVTDPQKKHKSLKDKVKNNGTVRVIIELTTDFKQNLSKSNQANQMAAIHADQNSLINTLSSDGILSYHNFKYSPQMAMTVNEKTLNQLLSSKMVKSIQVDAMNTVHLDQTLPIIQAGDAFSSGFDGTGQTVAILDTGINSTHNMFSDGATGNRIVSEACYASDLSEPEAADSWICAGDTLEEDESLDSARPCSNDNHATIFPGCEHGTHVAGIAAGNNVGVSGPASGVAKDANIIAIQVFTIHKGTDKIDGPDGDIAHLCPGGTPGKPTFCLSAFNSDIIKGLERVLELHNDVGFTYPISSVNLSLGTPKAFLGPDCDMISFDGISPKMPNPLKPAIDNLRTAGIATIISSGNSFAGNAISHPACISSAISVSTTDDSNNIPAFANEAIFLDFFAPGIDVNSSVPGPGDDDFEEKDGTSMSAPHVTGAWAILREADNTATVDDIYTLLSNTGIDIPLFDPADGITTKPLIQLGSALLFCGKPIPFYDNVIFGTSGNDNLFGTDDKDLMFGKAGNDSMNGGAGDDCLIGGSGDDILDGGAGNDELRGGAGDDSLQGSSGNDILYGGIGSDRLSGGSGDDELYGGDDGDSLKGGSGQDALLGEGGDDILSGGSGDDNLTKTFPSGQKAGLYGGEGDDDLAGRDGNDHCDGGTGNDYSDATCETII